MNQLSFQSSAQRCAGLVLLCSLSVLAYPTAPRAQDYPTRPITLVVPFTPGTGYDLIARVVGPELTKQLGEAVIVDNRPGASGIIGSRSVARSAPDGYTVLMIGEGILAAPLVSKSNKFDAVAELTPVGLAGYGTLLLAASTKSGFKSVADLVAAAKAAPNKINYASPGVGTTQNIRTEQFAHLAGIKLQHIPYRGSAGALNDLLSGQVEALLIPIHQAEEHIDAGRIVPLAVIGPKRNARAPSVPTLAESGFPSVQARMWYAFAAPKDLPEAIQSRLNTSIKIFWEIPDIRGRLEKIGLEITTSTPDELQSMMRSEAKAIAPVIKDIGITTD